MCGPQPFTGELVPAVFVFVKSDSPTHCLHLGRSHKSQNQGENTGLEESDPVQASKPGPKWAFCTRGLQPVMPLLLGEGA